MSAVSERYKRLSDAFAAKVAAVPDDKWDNRTPCDNWTTRDLVSHVVDTQGMFLGFVGKEMGDIPSVADDPVAAWDAARGKIQRTLDDPESAKAEFDGFSGRTTFEESVNRFLCVDQVIHGWDLARSAGLDERIPPEDVEWVRMQAAGYGDAMRSPMVFGPEVEAPAGADDQDRLLAYLGRKP
jgi:uncharacterized protein (TIGR03086 family)